MFVGVVFHLISFGSCLTYVPCIQENTTFGTCIQTRHKLHTKLPNLPCKSSEFSPRKHVRSEEDDPVDPPESNKHLKSQNNHTTKPYHHLTNQNKTRHTIRFGIANLDLIRLKHPRNFIPRFRTSNKPILNLFHPPNKAFTPMKHNLSRIPCFRTIFQPTLFNLTTFTNRIIPDRFTII
ncbi:hypothetical protein Hanom_Chr09g00810751 [Helianthus anomalus]